MANLDSKLIARRQKDLDDYVEQYDMRLEIMTNKFRKDLAPAWQRMTAGLEKKIKALYGEAGALQDPKKIRALTNKAHHLEALAGQLADDLNRMHTGLQPYYTGVINQVFEDSYYMHGYYLEQAARVSVQLPLLTPAMVLGITANPWLPDGANYSDRLRANTAYLAEKMRKILPGAVSQGWGWNETARAIRAVAGEGYFNAVRLARTELNRAAALASSYTFMQNADILDGKRWNATLDSRTAAKDADNDGRVYDLDYDTPENPGVPGQRIPNHPHCRCKWSPALSALGVSEKERIARDSTDNPQHFGKNYYTKARTYRDYAKERNLPDLDERLKKDNLKAYLRPGETIADINKNVVYWKAKGGPVAVPKPLWEQVKKTTKRPSVKGAAKVKMPTAADTTKPPSILNAEDQAAIAKFKTLMTDTDQYIKPGNFKRREFAKKILENANMKPMAVVIKQSKKANGWCSGYFQSGSVNYIEYGLNSLDTRSDTQKIKTALHEFFHANANGLRHDRVDDAWRQIEETFTESAAHFMTKELGIPGADNIAPSYSDLLTKYLPRMKQLPEFKGCETIEDFGAKVMKYRFGSAPVAEWRKVYNDVSSINVDMKQYAAQYQSYFNDHVDEVVNLIFESYMDTANMDRTLYAPAIKNAITDGWNKASGPYFEQALVTVMKKVGVK